MPTVIRDTHADEGSTLAVTVTLKDEDGDAINAAAVTALTWTLTTLDGTVINSREDVAVGSITNPVTVVLSGDDLPFSGSGASVWLELTVEGTYNSDLGTGLPVTGSCQFQVDDLAGVS